MYKPEAVTEPPLLLILGMHRSGTSCLTGMLKYHGLVLGDEVSNWNPFNLKGNQEARFVNSVNEELLSVNGGTSRQPILAEQVPDDIRSRIDGYKCRLRVASGDHACGIKDPRLLFCLNAWLDAGVRFIGTVRHPALVRASLNRRLPQGEHVADEVWDELWFKYNSQLYDLYQQHNFPIVDFTWDNHRYKNAVAMLAVRLGLAHRSVETFYDDTLRHTDGATVDIGGKYLALYAQLAEIAQREESKLLGARQAQSN